MRSEPLVQWGIRIGDPVIPSTTLREALLSEMKDQPGSVTKWAINMAEVEYLDSSALGMLLMLRERAGGDRAAIDIVSCSPGVKNILKMAKFDGLFNIDGF